MKQTINLFFILLLMSCGTSSKLSTCGSKAPSRKQAAKMILDAPIESIDRHLLNVQYIVLDYVAPSDTTALESYLVASHNNLNFVYQKALLFTSAPYIIYEHYDISIDDSRAKFDDFIQTLDNVGRDDGTIYVYVVGNTTNTLLGYTYVFPTCKDCYLSLAPKFDFIVLSRESIENTNTLAHEVGHFGGLPHTFEIKEKDLHKYGLDSAAAFCHNTMGYVCCAHDVTDVQVGMVWNYIAINRHNLIQNGFIFSPN